MEILTKRQVQDRLGGSSFWAPIQLVNKVSYASGIDPYDELLGESWLDEAPLIVVVRSRGMELQLMVGFSYNRVAIPDEVQEKLVVEPAEKVVEEKERSIVGRALAGGLLVGPVGAVVGGMTGLRDKNVDETPDSFITIEVSYQEAPIVFTVSEDYREEVSRFFQEHFSGSVELH